MRNVRKNENKEKKQPLDAPSHRSFPSRQPDSDFVRIRKQGTAPPPKRPKTTKPPPPSITEQTPRKKVALSVLMRSSLIALVKRYRTSIESARAHHIFLLITAIVFACLDVAAFLLNLDKYHAENSLDFYRVHNWDRAFTALLILVAADLGVLFAHRQVQSQTNFGDVTGDSRRFTGFMISFRKLTSDTFSIFCILFLPTVIRFSTAIPSSSPDVFPLSTLDWIAIILTGIFFIIAASIIGAIASLAASDIRLNVVSASTGFQQASFALSQTGMMLMILFAAAIIVSVRTSANTESLLRLMLASFSSDGIASLLKYFTARDIDISLSSGFHRMAALLKTSIFCVFIYSVLAFLIITIKYVSAKLPIRRRSLSGFTTAAFSLAIWFGAAFVVIAAHPFLTGIELIGDYETAPAQLISMMGFGLALAAAWIAVNLDFRRREFTSFVFYFIFPSFIFNTEVALTGITPNVGALALNASFVTFAALGLLSTTVMSWFAYLFCRNKVNQSACIRFGVAAAMFISLILAKAGGYGTGSAGEMYTTMLNPFAVADSYTAYLASTGRFPTLLIFLIAFVAIAFSIYKFNRNNCSHIK